MLYLCIGLAIVNAALLLLSVMKRKTLWWILLYGYELVGVIASLLVVAYYDSLPTSGPMPGLSYAADTFSALQVCGLFCVMFVISWIVTAIVVNREPKKKE